MIALSLCHLWSFKVGVWGYKISLPSKMCVFYIIMDWSMLSGGVAATPKVSLCGNKGFSIYLFIVQLHLSTMCQWQFAQVFIQWSRNGKRKQTTKKRAKPNPAWSNPVILEGDPENFPRDFVWGTSHCSILYIWLASHQGGLWNAELMPPLTQVPGHLKSPRHHLEQHPLEMCKST